MIVSSKCYKHTIYGVDWINRVFP